MSEKQEHRKRMYFKLEYLYRLEKWLKDEPKVWRIRARIRWRKARPIYDPKGGRVMDKAEELNALYNFYANMIDSSCMAIGMGVNVEKNRQENTWNSAKIDEIRAEADRLGIKLERRR